MKREKSCGAIVFTRMDGEVKFLIAKSVKGVGGFPKGHMEEGESEIQTARREILEEVGLKPRFIRGFRTKEEYLLTHKPDTVKTVIYFLAEYDPEEQNVTCQKEEISEAVLMNYAEALKTLPYYRKHLLRAAHEYMTKNNMM
ncbi:MAG: NUDIX domain-containing protein [Dorea sp.]|nr:NUDIX domain-containing protein [Dorea sp.]